MSQKKARIPKETLAEWREALRVILIEVLILFVILFVVTMIIHFKYPEFTGHFRSVSDFQSFMHAHQSTSGLIYIGLQIMQIVISIIPGQIVQIAGGYLFGFWIAAFLSLIGVGLGSAAAFYIARFFGQKPVRILVGQKALDRCSKYLDSRTSYRVFFFLYLLPGFPKDILAYVAGLSRMKMRSFLPMATIIRFPAMAASMYIGSLLGAESYQASAVMILLCIVVFGICIAFREKLNVLIDRYFDRTSDFTFSREKNAEDVESVRQAESSVSGKKEKEELEPEAERKPASGVKPETALAPPGLFDLFGRKDSWNDK